VRSGDYEGTHARRRGLGRLRDVVNGWLEEVSFRTGMTMAAVALVIVAGIAVGAVLLPGNGHASDHQPTMANSRPVVATTASRSPSEAPTSASPSASTAATTPAATFAPAATTTAAAPSPTPSTRQPTETPSPTASATPTFPWPFPTVPGCHHRHNCGGLRGRRHRNPAADRWPGEHWALGAQRDARSVG
jgi:hypothetical protein